MKRRAIRNGDIVERDPDTRVECGVDVVRRIVDDGARLEASAATSPWASALYLPSYPKPTGNESCPTRRYFDCRPAPIATGSATGSLDAIATVPLQVSDPKTSTRRVGGSVRVNVTSKLAF